MVEIFIINNKHTLNAFPTCGYKKCAGVLAHVLDEAVQSCLNIRYYTLDLHKGMTIKPFT